MRRNKYSFTKFSTEFRSYLSPRLREILDSCIQLEKRLKSANHLLDKGLFPPITERNEISVLTGRIVDGVDAVCSKSSKIKNELSKIRSNIREYENMALKLTLTDRMELNRYGSALSKISNFVFSFVLPVFSELAKEMAINPDSFWKFMHDKFRQKAEERIGKRPEKKEEEKE